mgnify:CR=1 FL=1
MVRSINPMIFECRMKKILFFLFTCALTIGSVQAQEAADSIKIYYRRGYRNVDPSFRDNRSQLEYFLNSIGATLKNDRVEKIVIRSYASPDGAVQANEQLAARRAEELKAYLYTIGVRNWRIFTIFPVGRAANHPEFQLTDEEFTGVLEFIKKVRKEGRVHLSYGCEGFLGKYESEVRDHFYSCNAGISVASVLADGSISSCPSIRSNFHQGNIYEDDFMEVWEKRFQVFRNREWARKGECADCSFFRYCEGNGMHLHNDNGDLLFCHQKRIVEL